MDLILVPFVAVLVVLSLHAYLGVHVLARGVIFVDLAFAQIAAFGGTVYAVWASDHGGSITAFLFAYGFTLLGAVLFSFTRMERSLVPQEAIIGISYVVASAAVLLVSSMTAEGAEHVSETLTGTLIWVTWPEIIRMSIGYALLGVFYWAFRRNFLAATFHPEQLERPRLWDFLFYATFGIAITFSVAIAGVLLVFTTLVIPATVALLFTNRFGRAVVLAWVVGAFAAALGLALSFWRDFATGPTLVVAFGIVLVGAGVVRRMSSVDTGDRILLQEDRSGAAP
ncbi:MAG: metal ABC transporter permease [Gemmatimonadota bacterium]|nr:metal ABC transporter permease [Gemmatimonadota bacterium]